MHSALFFTKAGPTTSRFYCQFVVVSGEITMAEVSKFSNRSKLSGWILLLRTEFQEFHHKK